MSTLNLILQTFHNLTRWAVIIFALIAIIRAFSGWFGKKDFGAADNKAGLLYTIFFDLQILLGLILYFSKGWAGVLAADFGAAMSNSGLRFFAIEHLFVMIIAMGIAHVGRSVSRKAVDAVKKHRRAAIWYTISLLLLLASIPWPFLSYGRPWLRLFGISF